MNPLLKKILFRYMAPAGEDGTDTTGTNTAVADPDDDYLALPEEERRKLRGDLDGDDVSQESLQSLIASEGGEGGGGGQPPAGGDAAHGAEDDGTGGQGTRGGGIPRARFNEVNDERKAALERAAALEAELAQLRGSQPVQTAAPAAAPAPAAERRQLDVAQAEEQYAQLMLDGDTKEAAKLRMQINAAIEDSAFERYRQANAASAAQARATETVESLIQAYPWLEEPEGAEAMDLIEASVAFKTGRGIPLHQAVTEAVQTIAPRFAPAGHPPGGIQGQGGSVDIRPGRAARRGAQHSMLQPPSVQAGLGNRSTAAAIDPTKITDDEYMELPEAERKRLRGD
ncbi:hypothetical protein KDK82_2303 [Delftia sp. K82]|uniref:hypothetical protein n=1 Tax=Delftia sp. K82 TaxID=1472718 RepID=UPI000B489E01|nr:hypothetical protein [Delftia sp. K82]OWG18823.1 hypothetical protein KDK82_2303 [Delftia sp. K82]